MVLWLAACAGDKADDLDTDILDTDPEPTIQVPDAPPGSLVRTTVLDPGDEDCEAGGIRIDLGVDDGSRDSTPRDGVLQDGEVRSSEVICNGVGAVPETEAPTGPVGSSVIDLSGGDGGGDGGELEVGVTAGPFGEIALWAEGAVDASGELPAASWGLGLSPVVVGADETLRIIADAQVAALEADTLYLAQDGELLWWDGVRSSRPTGLHIPAGVTLSTPGGPGAVEITVSQDVVVEGSFVAPGRNVAIRCRNLVLSGAVDTSSEVGAGGDLDITASTQVLGLSVGLVHVDGGQIDLAGGGTGRGGALQVGAATAVWWSGDVIADGGADGGPGGDLEINFGGRLWAEGTWSSVGGMGADGGAALVVADQTHWSADLTASGGEAGGDGGEVILSIHGSLVLAGDLISDGGDGGGEGGDVSVFVEGLGASLTMGGSISAHGGDGGGHAGDVVLMATDAENGPSALRVYGLASIDLSGGGGEAEGGHGGSVEMWMAPVAPVGVEEPVGSIRVGSEVDLSGGAGDRGGDGGSVEAMSTSDGIGGRSRVEWRGSIAAGGGAGGAEGGAGGHVFLFGDAGVLREGEIDVAGGDASGVGAVGGDAQRRTESSASVELWSERGLLRSVGRVDARGGHALVDGRGGESGGVILHGTLVTHEGDLDVRGGNGNGIDGQGAAGGVVSLYSIDGGTQNAAGVISVSGGTGALPGSPGTVLEDGFDTTAAWMP